MVIKYQPCCFFNKTFGCKVPDTFDKVVMTYSSEPQEIISLGGKELILEHDVGYL